MEREAERLDLTPCVDAIGTGYLIGDGRALMRRQRYRKQTHFKQQSAHQGKARHVRDHHLVSFAPGTGSVGNPSRNRIMYLAMSTACSSTAKWPASIRWSSAFGRSRRYAVAPAGTKAASFLPQTMSVGGCCFRRNACQAG